MNLRTDIATKIDTLDNLVASTPRAHGFHPVMVLGNFVVDGGLDAIAFYAENGLGKSFSGGFPPSDANFLATLRRTTAYLAGVRAGFAAAMTAIYEYSATAKAESPAAPCFEIDSRINELLNDLHRWGQAIAAGIREREEVDCDG